MSGRHRANRMHSMTLRNSQDSNQAVTDGDPHHGDQTVTAYLAQGTQEKTDQSLFKSLLVVAVCWLLTVCWLVTVSFVPHWADITCSVLHITAGTLNHAKEVACTVSWTRPVVTFVGVSCPVLTKELDLPILPTFRSVHDKFAEMQRPTMELLSHTNYLIRSHTAIQDIADNVKSVDLETASDSEKRHKELASYMFSAADCTNSLFYSILYSLDLRFRNLNRLEYGYKEIQTSWFKADKLAQLEVEFMKYLESLAKMAKRFEAETESCSRLITHVEQNVQLARDHQERDINLLQEKPERWRMGRRYAAITNLETLRTRLLKIRHGVSYHDVSDGLHKLGLSFSAMRIPLDNLIAVGNGTDRVKLAEAFVVDDLRLIKAQFYWILTQLQTTSFRLGGYILQMTDYNAV